MNAPRVLSTGLKCIVSSGRHVLHPRLTKNTLLSLNICLLGFTTVCFKGRMTSIRSIYRGASAKISTRRGVALLFRSNGVTTLRTDVRTTASHVNVVSKSGNRLVIRGVGGPRSIGILSAGCRAMTICSTPRRVANCRCRICTSLRTVRGN